MKYNELPTLLKIRIQDSEYYTNIPIRILIDQVLDKSEDIEDFKIKLREEITNTFAHARDLISDIYE